MERQFDEPGKEEPFDIQEARIVYGLSWDFGIDGLRVLEDVGGPGFIERILTSK